MPRRDDGTRIATLAHAFGGVEHQVRLGLRRDRRNGTRSSCARGRGGSSFRRNRALPWLVAVRRSLAWPRRGHQAGHQEQEAADSSRLQRHGSSLSTNLGRNVFLRCNPATAMDGPRRRPPIALLYVRDPSQSGDGNGCFIFPQIRVNLPRNTTIPIERWLVRRWEPWPKPAALRKGNPAAAVA